MDIVIGLKSGGKGFTSRASIQDANRRSGVLQHHIRQMKRAGGRDEAVATAEKRLLEIQREMIERLR